MDSSPVSWRCPKEKQGEKARQISQWEALELLVVLILVVIFNLNRVEQVAIVEILQSGEKNDIAWRWYPRCTITVGRLVENLNDDTELVSKHLMLTPNAKPGFSGLEDWRNGAW